MEKVDITPDPSLISKLGATGYRTYEALAELIDNSIDARIPQEKLKVNVVLDFGDQTITVKDNGAGMDIETMKNAMTLAHTDKKKKKLGFYGLGLKTAASSLGKMFSIRAKKASVKKEFSCAYDENIWINGGKSLWREFSINQEVENSDLHYTIIKIEKLKANIYRNMVGRFRDAFSRRYGPLLESSQIEIWVNTLKCEPTKIEIIEGSKKEFYLKLPSGNVVHGWGALQKGRKGENYGFNLYKNDRLIKEWDKSLLGREAHASISMIIGDIYLDHVPALFNKTDFLRESEEFVEVEKYFPEYEKLKELKREATEPKYFKEIADSTKEKIIDVTKSFIDNINKLDEYDFASLEKFHEGEDQYFFQFKLKTHNIERKVVVYFSFLKTINPLEVLLDNPIVIKINQNSPLFYLSHDKTQFINTQIANAVSYIITKLNNLLIDDFLEINNKLTVIGIKEAKRKKTPQKMGLDEAKKMYETNLIDELRDINSELKIKLGEDSFYFTATSILSSHLIHIPRINYYFIYCERGLGEKIQSHFLENYGKKYVVLLNPRKIDPSHLDDVLKNTESSDIVVIRERERESVYKKEGSVASPEIALVDLVFEIVKNDLPLPLSDVSEMTANFYLSSKINKRKLKRYAGQRGLKSIFMKIEGMS